MGDSHSWPHYTPDCLAVDSKQNVYVTGGYEDAGDANYVKKCVAPTWDCADFSGDWKKGGSYDNPIAVDINDNVYISDQGRHELLRCTPDNKCQNLGAFDGGNNMVVAVPGIFYVADGAELHRVCLPQLTADVVVV